MAAVVPVRERLMQMFAAAPDGLTDGMSCEAQCSDSSAVL